MQQETYKAKSVIIGRKRDFDENLVCFVCLYNINDPHKTDKLPDKMLEYAQVHKVIFKDMELNFLLEGNDIVLNDLEELHLAQDGMGHLLISGKQNP